MLSLSAGPAASVSPLEGSGNFPKPFPPACPPLPAPGGKGGDGTPIPLLLMLRANIFSKFRSRGNSPHDVTGLKNFQMKNSYGIYATMVAIATRWPRYVGELMAEWLKGCEICNAGLCVRFDELIGQGMSQPQAAREIEKEQREQLLTGTSDIKNRCAIWPLSGRYAKKPREKGFFTKNCAIVLPEKGLTAESKAPPTTALSERR